MTETAHTATGDTIPAGRQRIVTGGFTLSGRPASITTLFSDVWRARQLISVLARKDFYVRYRRATFGLLWAAALPLLQAGALAFVVSRFATFDTGSDYVVFVLSGTVAWSTFSSVINIGSSAIVDGSGLSTKIYFPRLVLPLTTVWTSAYGLAISSAVLIAAALISGVGVGARTLLLVPAGALTLVLAGSFAVVLSALHVYFRDVRYLVQAALLVWLYVTPVIYPLTAIGNLRPWIEANPVTGVVELHRAATVGADPGWMVSLWWTAAWCVGLTILGLVLHRRYDRVFVDLL